MIRINGIQLRDHEIKRVIFAEDTTFFLGDITCFSRIQVILRLYQDASTSMINFSKAKEHVSLWAGAYERTIHQPGQTEWSQFFIKILGDNFGNSILDNFN